MPMLLTMASTNTLNPSSERAHALSDIEKKPVAFTSGRVTHIESRDNPVLKQLRKLIAEPAAYRKLGQIWIEGEHLCLSALQQGCKPEIAVLTETAWKHPTLRHMTLQVPAVRVIPDAVMSTLSTLETPAPIAFVLRWPGSEALWIQPDRPTVVLDRLQDPGNVGAILRSAAVFGFKQILALKGTAALWSPKVVRAAMGAHFGLHLLEGLELSALQTLRAPLVATSSHAQINLAQTALPWPCAWVLGHEGQGIAPELVQLCQQQVRIAQPGGQESLNVSAAATVCFYESARQNGFQLTTAGPASAAKIG
jgi:RNA methyltransferase, TrmH family